VGISKVNALNLDLDKEDKWLNAVQAGKEAGVSHASISKWVLGDPPRIPPELIRWVGGEVGGSYLIEKEGFQQWLRQQQAEHDEIYSDQQPDLSKYPGVETRVCKGPCERELPLLEKFWQKHQNPYLQGFHTHCRYCRQIRTGRTNNGGNLKGVWKEKGKEKAGKSGTSNGARAVKARGDATSNSNQASDQVTHVIVQSRILSRKAADDMVSRARQMAQAQAQPEQGQALLLDARLAPVELDKYRAEMLFSALPPVEMLKMGVVRWWPYEGSRLPALA
jgi:hypothetical protein